MSLDQNELERLLRATMSTRAQDIGYAPQFAPERVAPATPFWRSARFLAPLAAAACVVALVGGILIGTHGHTDHPATKVTPTPTPTVTHPPTPGPTGSPTPTPTHTGPKQIATLACSITLPSSWKSALADSGLTSGGRIAQPLSMTPDGGVVVFRDDNVTPGSGRAVVLLQPGTAAKTLYSVPNPDRFGVSSADVSGRWLVVGISQLPRPAKNTIPGSSPMGIVQIVAVDLTTGASHVIISTPAYSAAAASSTGAGTAIDNAVVQNGHVYWDERASYAAQSGDVKDYDLATQVTKTVFIGAAGYLGFNAGGVILDPQNAHKTVVTATLPAVVDRAMTPFARAHLGSDGTSYGWAASSQSLGWWRPGMSAPVYVTIPAGLNTDENGGTPIVAGQYLGTVGSGFRLTDMLTHASATISDSDFGQSSRGELVFGSNGAFAGDRFSNDAAHYIGGYWADSPIQPIRLDTKALPEFGC